MIYLGTKMGEYVSKEDYKDLPLLSDAPENIPLFIPNIPAGAIDEISTSLNSRWIGQGPKVELFEKLFSSHFLNDHPAVSVSSGTAALHLAYIAAGIKEDDEVLCPVFTCTATNIPLLYLKAKIIFVDIDPLTMNISIQDLRKKITDKSRAIVVVNYGGLPCEMDEVNKVASENNLIVISDNAQALGAEYKGIPIGLTSDISIYSFQAIKHITTGDGGMIGLNEKFHNKTEFLKRIRWFGIDRSGKQKGIWENDISEIGFKYQMTDLSASLGISGIGSFQSTLAHRRNILSIYEKLLGNNNDVGIIGHTNDNSVHAAWLFTIRVKDRKKLQIKLRDRSIESNQVHFRNDRYSIFKNRSNMGTEFPNMDSIQDDYLVLPLHTKMKESDVQRICNEINSGW
jgi:perosamine synthetase